MGKLGSGRLTGKLMKVGTGRAYNLGSSSGDITVVAQNARSWRRDGSLRDALGTYSAEGKVP